VYAVAIGPLVQRLLPLAIVELPERPTVTAPAEVVPDASDPLAA
jgi:hypothetical protein